MTNVGNNIDIVNKSHLAVWAHLKDTYGFDQDTLMRVIKIYGHVARESVQMGYEPFAIANLIQSEWATSERTEVREM